MKITLKHRTRLVFLSLFLFLLFSLLVLQFYKIQIIEGERWTKQALAQHQLVVVEPCKRGIFYSNTSILEGHPDTPQPFVVDVPKYHLFADPLAIPEEVRAEVEQRVAAFLALDAAQFSKLKAHFAKRARSRKLAAWIDRRTRDEIQGWWLAFARAHKIARNALFFVEDYQRSYPFGKLLGQVLHTVREELGSGVRKAIPTGGLELVFNKFLEGKEGKRLILRSPRHPLEAGRVLSSPEHGADVYLTINHCLQAIVEEEISKAVKKAGAKRGWAVMMEPRSGEILALAQYPWFEPANCTNYFNDPALLEDTKVKAVTDPFEPGSTIKPATLALCLKANEELKKRGKSPIFTPDEKVDCRIGHIPGRSKPLRDLRMRKFLNLDMALQKSSNVYMAKMTYRAIEALGVEWYRKVLEELFGLGVKTGIELPSESPGLLPRFGKRHPNGALEWSAPTPCSLSFGYNLLATSLQMLRIYAIIANGGYDVRPTLVRKIVKQHADGSEEVLLDNTRPERIAGFARLLEPESVDTLISAMKYVTKQGGTSPLADIFGYTEVGKSSTTEKLVKGVYTKKDHIASFVGFAPAKNARFVIAIAIDEPEYKFIPGVGRNQRGGVCAAPVFREIGTRVLRFLGVEPDDPHGFPPHDPRYDPEKADWIKKTKELKILYETWNDET